MNCDPELNVEQPVTAYMVGNSSLSIQCATYLLENQHQLYGIATSDRNVEKWAKGSSVPCLYFQEQHQPDTSQLVDFFSQRTFDYLFSIDNSVILREDILALPQKLAINYHDGPLPRYGGVNATSWAILKGEKEHGICWHVVDQQVDAGDILKRYAVKISEQETALTLNGKCYAGAIETFQELVPSLVAGRVKREPQNLGERSFFSSTKRPSPACILDWDQPAERLSAFVRSLDHGPYPNYLGLPKFLVSDEFVLVTKLNRLSRRSTITPGAVVAIEPEQLVVSTADFDVAISGLQTIGGRPLPVLQVSQRYDLELGVQLPHLDSDSQQKIVALTKEIHQYEDEWITRASSLKPVQIPYVDRLMRGELKDGFEHQELEIPEEVYRYHLAQKQPQSFGEFLLSHFVMYLGRLSGSFKFDVGFQSPDLKEIVKENQISPLFARFVPLQVDCNATGSVRDGVEAIRAEIERCKRRKTFALDALARYPEAPSAGDFLQSMNVVFQINNDPQVLEIELVDCQADLLIQIPNHRVDGGSTKLIWCYKANRIAAESILRMQKQFLVHLTRAIEDHDHPLFSMPLLSNAEQHRILVDWNQKTGGFRQDQFLHTLFEDQAERVPNSTAVVLGDHSLTYRELNERSTALAHALSKIGVGAEMLVGLFLERSIDMIVGILGILKAGGAYVPIRDDDPEDRLDYLLKDTDVSVVVTTESVKDKLPATRAKLFTLDSDWDEADSNLTGSYDSGLSVDDLAYVIYTSGSTGRPKGVMMSHRSLVNRFLWELDAFKRDETDVVLQQFSISFDYSVWEIFAAFTAGACLVMTKAKGEMDGEYITDLIKQEGITVAGFVPAMLESVLDRDDLSDIDSLREVSSGGEELTLELQATYFEKMTAVLDNGYGPTEACIDATYWTCQPDYEYPVIPIGRPLANSAVYILDKYLQPVPVGVSGELFVAGVGLARGYLNQPEMTAEKFIPNPFSQIPGDRMYRTGDLAYYLPDGNIVFVGREDKQIQLRGHRVELNEIQIALDGHPAIGRSIVVAQGERHLAKQIVAYVKLNDGGQLTNSGLRESLTQLPAYMLPSTVVLVDTFPLTSNGKIDYASLPEPSAQNRLQDEMSVPPRTSDEAELVDIWQEVLGVKPIGVHDNFFALGGHSLMITQIALRMREQLNVELPIHTIFETPTIAELALKRNELPPLSVRGESSEITASSKAVIQPATREGVFPLSFAQQGLWFLDQLETDNIAYNIPQAYLLEGRLNINGMRRSLTDIVARHEALRTTFELAGSEPVQMIQPASAIELPLVDLSDSADPEKTAGQLIEQINEKPFDLSRDLMLRASLYKLAHDKHILALHTHHIAYDGWSDSVLLHELATLYKAHCGGTAAELPHLPIQYGDYCVWQREGVDDAKIEEDLDFWRTRLAGVTPLELPTDFPRPPRLTFKGGTVSFTLSETTTDRLNAVAQRHNSTLFMTLLSAFKLMLNRYTGQSDIVIGTSIGNRTLSEIEPLIGFFINTVVIRSHIDPSEPFESLLRQVRETILAGYEHQSLPFERLVEALQPERDLSRNPIFQVLFVLQNTPAGRLELPGLDHTYWPLEHKTTHIDFECEFKESDGRLSCEFVYNTALFTQETVQRMAHHFENLLELIGAGDDRPVFRLPLLSPQEVQSQSRWNDTRVPLPEQSLIELFSAQVAQTPDRTALIYGDESISYQALARRAAGLASDLQAQGVSPGDRVGVAFERSPELFVSLLAILAVGAVYVPLEVNLPQERLQWMIRDAQLSLLLTAEPHVDLFAQTGCHIICLDRLERADPSADFSKIKLDRPADAPAYIMYTSGSTGKPKGVVGLEHGILNRLQWMWRTYPFADGEIGCQKTSLNFVDSIWESLGPLLKGVPTLIVPDKVVKDPADFVELLATHEVSRLVLVPTLLNLLLDLYGDLDRRLPKLKFWVSSGERLPADVCTRFHKQMPGRRLLNLYGSTEVAADATVFDTANLSPEHRSVPIGRPIDNTQLYILPVDQPRGPMVQTVPIGVVGELVVGGAGVAQGYWEKEGLTAATFTTHPLDKEQRLFKTGDLARYLADGTVEIVGRKDRQLKLRGHRIEPAEIEKVLLQNPDVHAAHLQSELKNKQDQLVAYVVAEPGFETATLRSYLGQQLPQYMIPTDFVRVGRLPQLPNGKIDSAKLALTDRPLVTKNRPSPQDPTEQLLLDIWEEVLDRGSISTHDNFFDLGGHSLLGIRLFAAIKDQLGVMLPVATLFQAPTVAEMAHQLRDGQSSSPHTAWQSLTPIRSSGDKPPFFCVHGLGGGVIGYKDLADLLEADRPFVGLTAVGRDDGQPPHESIEEMATHYIEAMQAMQTEGPYHLGGYCYGGIVAYEMARQLHAMGESVALLAIFEGYAIGVDEAWQELMSLRGFVSFITNIPFWLRDTVQQEGVKHRITGWLHQPSQSQSISEIRDWGSEEAANAVQQFIQQDANLLPPAHRKVLMTHARGIAAYDPLPYLGKIDLFRVKAMSTLRATDPTMGWGKLAAGGVEIHKIAGAHYNILEQPHVMSLAQKLQACLDQLSESSAGQHARETEFGLTDGA